MKRTGFKKKTLEEVKAKQAEKKLKVKTVKKTVKKRSKYPNWVKKIPLGSHGAGELQKRLWKITSDYVRIRDWYKYNGRCVATGEYIQNWKEGQAGHYKPYSVCNGLFKFDIMNIHLQSAMSNKRSGADDGFRFGQELQRRYSGDILQKIEEENKKYHLQKITNEMCLEKIIELLDKMERLEEKPDYYYTIIDILEK